MARKTHVIGYRLGEATWWKTRTPGRGERTRGIEKLVKGIMERYGYITGEVMVQQGWGKGAITLVGGRGGRMEVYIMEYIKEIIKKSKQGTYKISYREEEKIERNAEMMYREIVKSPQTIMTTIWK